MTIATLVSIVAAGAAFAGPAFAHNEPGRATTLKMQLVQAHDPCPAPNAITSTGLAACAPEVQSDPGCQFTEKGVGRMTVSVKGTQIGVKAALKGLDAPCEGRTLTAVVSLRATTDDCPTSACTADVVDLPLGTCNVTRGKCAVGGIAGRGVFVGGTETGLELLGCGLKNGGARTFSCGILLP